MDLTLNKLPLEGHPCCKENCSEMSPTFVGLLSHLDKAKISPTVLELLFCDYLRKCINLIHISRYLFHFQLALFKNISDKMKSQLNMFSLIVKCCILGQMNSTYAFTKESMLFASHFTQEMPQPSHFLGTFSESNVFNFDSWKCNHLLQSRNLTDCYHNECKNITNNWSLFLQITSHIKINKTLHLLSLQKSKHNQKCLWGTAFQWGLLGLLMYWLTTPAAWAYHCVHDASNNRWVRYSFRILFFFLCLGTHLGG